MIWAESPLWNGRTVPITSSDAPVLSRAPWNQTTVYAQQLLRSLRKWSMRTSRSVAIAPDARVVILRFPTEHEQAVRLIPKAGVYWTVIVPDIAAPWIEQ